MVDTVNSMKQSMIMNLSSSKTIKDSGTLVFFKKKWKELSIKLMPISGHWLQENLPSPEHSPATILQYIRYVLVFSIIVFLQSFFVYSPPYIWAFVPKMNTSVIHNIIEPKIRVRVCSSLSLTVLHVALTCTASIMSPSVHRFHHVSPSVLHRGGCCRVCLRPWVPQPPRRR
jgi:hypothetical protein